MKSPKTQERTEGTVEQIRNVNRNGHYVPPTDTQEAGEQARSWLWPDRVIGKRESRTLRDEHNALVNSNAELLAAARKLNSVIAKFSVVNGYVTGYVSPADSDAFHDGYSKLRAAIAKAEGK